MKRLILKAIAIDFDHVTGQVLAYVLATHEDEAFVPLKALLEPFGMMQFYRDGWGTYGRHIEPELNDWHARPFACPNQWGCML